MTPIRVVVADDQALIRLALRTLTSAEADIDVVAEAVDGKEAWQTIRELQPNVVLLDIRMPVMDGLEVLRTISNDPQLAHVHAIMMTTFDVDQYIFEALELGAAGFITKDTDPSQILQAIRIVHSGDALLAPSVTRRVIDRFTQSARNTGTPHNYKLDSLTSREIEVVGWVATGRSNEEIATQLFLSPATVRTHIGRAMAKLGARDRSQLVVIAYRSTIHIPN